MNAAVANENTATAVAMKRRPRLTAPKLQDANQVVSNWTPGSIAPNLLPLPKLDLGLINTV